MRTLRWLLVAAVLSLPCTFVVQPSGVTPSAVVAFGAPGDPPAAPEAAPAAPGAPDIDVHIDGDRRVVWYASPLVLAIGAAAVALVVIIVALAGRGGGTTVIRER